jgi:hypothetical protein
MNKTYTFWIPLMMVMALLMAGCGGGGGGSSPVTTTTTGTTPTITPTVAPEPISTIAVKPTGYNSSAFPTRNANVAVTATSGKSTVIMVNNGSYEVAVPLSAKSVVVANVVPELRASISAPDFPTPAPVEHRFHQELRKLEHAMPAFTAGAPDSLRQANKAAIRSDFVGQETSFQVYMGGSQGTLSVPATCRRKESINGTEIYFYLDNSETYTTNAQNLISDLVTNWAGIYPTVKSVFGDEPPETLNGVALGNSITVLLTAKIGDLAGFFYSGDLYAPNQITTGVSNQRKMFYLNYDRTLKDYTASVLSSTMAHEFQHMVNFYQRHKLGLKEKEWLNEAMSGYSEHVCGYKVPTGANRSKTLQVRYFLNSIATVSLNIEPWPGNHENYGQVYLFGVWLGQLSAFNGSMKALLASNKTGIEAVAAIAGEDWNTVFSKWMIGLYVNDTTGNSPYGIKDFNLKGTYAGVALKGPAFTGIPVNSSTGNLRIGAYSSAYVEVYGTANTAMTLVLPDYVNSFEIHQ